jgi:aminopeptidase
MADDPTRRKSSDRMLRITASAPIVVDHGLALASKRVVDGSLGVVRGERLLVVADESTTLFGQALAEAAGELGATGQLICLEDLGPRPHRALHARVRDAVALAQASVLHIGFQSDELPMRTQLVELAALMRLRHAHMIGVTRGSIIAGLSTDPRRIAEISRALRIRIRPSSVIDVRSAAGTRLKVRFEPWCRWYETSGVIRAGTRANLPAGELVTSPASIDGVYVADGAAGDPDGALQVRLASAPVKIEFEAGTVRDIECRDSALAQRLGQLMRGSKNLDRAGLVSFGTNVGMTDLAGDIFTSQKLPGFHISLGMTFQDRTGASWDCPQWLAFTAMNVDVDIDGAGVMRGGRYLLG